MMEFTGGMVKKLSTSSRTLSVLFIAAALVSCGSDDAADPPADTTGAVESAADDGSLPNACPVDGCEITIANAAVQDGEIGITFDANYSPNFERNHIHIFWDSQEAGAVSSDFQERGFAEQGKWHPTDEYPNYVTQADASVSSEFRGDSTTLCVTAADTDHAVINADIVHCRDVAELLS